MAVNSVKSFKLQEFVAHTDDVNCLHIGRRCGQVLATGGNDCRVNVWRLVQPSSIYSLSGHSSPVECVSFDPNETSIVAGSRSGSLRLWDLETRKTIGSLAGHRSKCSCVDVHPYSYYVASGSADTNMKIWDIRHKACVQTYKGRGTHSEVDVVRFSPDGRLACSGSRNGNIRLYDLVAGKQRAEFQHKSAITDLKFHNKELLLLSGSKDKTVRVWDLDQCNCVGSTKPEPVPIRSCALTSEDNVVAVAAGDHVRIWQLRPLESQDYITLDIGNARIVDMTLTDSDQLVICALRKAFVSVWVVNLPNVLPFSKPDQFGKVRPVSELPITPPNPAPVKSGSAVSLPAAQMVTPLAPMQDSNAVSSAPEVDLTEEPAPTAAEVGHPPEESVGVGDDTFDPQVTRAPAVAVERAVGPGDTLKKIAALEISPERRGVGDPHLSASGAHVSEGAGSGEVHREHLVQSSSKDNVSALHVDSQAGESDGEPAVAEVPATETVRSDAIASADAKTDVGDDTDSPPSGEPPHPMLPIVDPFQVNKPPMQFPVQQGRPQGGLVRPNLPLGRRIRGPIGRRGPSPQGDHWANAEAVVPEPKKPVHESDPVVSVPKNRPVFKSDRSRPIGLDMAEFEKRGPSTAVAPPSDDPYEFVNFLMQEHETVKSILLQRVSTLRLAKGFWLSQNLKGVLDVISQSEDNAAFVDILTSANWQHANLKLSHANMLLPMTISLLSSRFEDYIMAAFNTLTFMINSFGNLVKNARTSSAYKGSGIDISREERLHKCNTFFNYMQQAAEQAHGLTSRSGEVRMTAVKFIGMVENLEI